MLIKVCPKSGERQSKNDFLLIFFYIQSKGAAQSSILMILRHPHGSILRSIHRYLKFWHIAGNSRQRKSSWIVTVRR